jgi:heme/copper-type cytochrome/quinol oxidase subunit 2
MESAQRYENRTASILLITASLILMANGILNMYRFSMMFGMGAGAYAESYAYNVTVAPGLAPYVSQLSAIYQTVLYAALAAGMGFIMFVMAFLLLVRGSNRYESYLKRYVPLHIMLTAIYVVLMMIMSVSFSSVFDSLAMYMSYVAIAVCVVLDVYLEYGMRKPAGARRAVRGISIDPSTPYSNLVRLKEELFDNLKGEVGIVDKHFNSAAMSNLHRLMPTEGTGIRSLTIITSEEMLDYGFGGNYQDLKNELKNGSVEVEVRIMKGEDSGVQHERFIFDDSVAYKIPPLSIINKKSEHVVKMSVHDAKKRFEYLYQNSVKFENYSVNRGRQA